MIKTIDFFRKNKMLAKVSRFTVYLSRFKENWGNFVGRDFCAFMKTSPTPYRVQDETALLLQCNEQFA
jgi:hypothetical protein